MTGSLTPADYRPDAILAVLHRHGVRYVLIGGFAAVLRGSAVPTYDVDIVPEPSVANLARLSAALRDLDARVRVDGMPGGLAFDHDADSLAQVSVLNLVTNAGDLDVALRPTGLSDFAAWDQNATDIVVLGIPTRLAALDDVIRSKEAAGRDKDLLALPMLRALAARLRRADG